ncbi:MAG: hypothetical protein PVI21_00095 [Candidatus Woesebacteria bacterium]|jgi:hypothetical protein
MSNRRQVHYWWRMLRRIKVWQLMILLAIFSVASVELLRQNNLGMIELRNMVKMADEQGNDAQTKQSLADLQSYIYSHMNTSMGERGIYLEHTYQRAYERTIQEGMKDDSESRNLYNSADEACQSVFNKTYSFPAYTQCVAERLANQDSSDPLASIKTPSVDLYRYNFTSPLWTPDNAGFVVLITFLILIFLLVRILLTSILFLFLHDRHQ